MQGYLWHPTLSCASEVLKVLGIGSQAGEITCVLSDGIAFARKWSTFAKSTAGCAILQEIKTLSRLSHMHVIFLLKAQEPTEDVEVFLWPVAPCDLTVFLNDLHEADNGGSVDETIWQALSLFQTGQLSPSVVNARDWLKRSVGCLCSSVAYVHNQGTWHHDLRPQNILVTLRGPVLADFAGALDLRELQEQRPSTSQLHENGYAADILLLGCVLLEMSSAVVGVEPRADADLNVLTDLSRTYERNFVSNSEQRANWIETLDQRSDATLRGLLDLVQSRLIDEPAGRPRASQVVQDLSVLLASGMLFGTCCVPQSGWKGTCV